MSIVPKWRIRSASYVYVDSFCGSDALGDGTQENPYQTLGKAWRGHRVLHPHPIICRGYFSEDMADGVHSTDITADYPGAATFDGQNQFILYGFTVRNMRIVNAPYGTLDTSVLYGDARLAGVGRASSAGGVGGANYVSGVAASSNTWASALYMGALGPQSNTVSCSHWKPKVNPLNKFWLAGGERQLARHATIYGVPKEDTRANQQVNGYTWESSIFGKVAILANQRLAFGHCFFTADCEWVNGDEVFVPTGDDNAARLASVKAWLASLNSQVTLSDDCVVSALTSEEVFNDPEAGDITLRLDCTEATFGNNDYFGAYPPSLYIPVRSDSTGQPGTWDETTATGLISVADDKIVIGDDNASTATTGEILSKVLILDPSRQSVAGVFAQYATQSANGVLLGNTLGDVAHYTADDTLPVGRYRLSGGDVVYNDTYVCEGDVIPVTVAGTKVTVAEGSDASAIRLSAINDCNAVDHIWLRACPTAYAIVRASDGLEAGGIYCNIGNKDVVYRGRTIVPGESFMAENSTDTFSCDDAEYRLAVIFDDSRVPEQPWIPAQMWGEYFAAKKGSVYQEDADGKPLGSGSYTAWLPKSIGGYSDILTGRTRAQAKYIQLRITANKSTI